MPQPDRPARNVRTIKRVANALACAHCAREENFAVQTDRMSFVPVEGNQHGQYECRNVSACEIRMARFLPDVNAYMNRRRRNRRKAA